MKQNLYILCVAASLWLSCGVANAQPENVRDYTERAPLVYEDVWDLWPYSFLNEKGDPEGFNVDLIRLLLDELEIPYVIKMKSSQEAFNDLRDGKSDLMMGLAVGFHDEYGQYSQTAVTLFTQSVATPKGSEVQIRRFKDLGNHKVIVSDSSLCHHLMIDYGWKQNAQPSTDIKESLLEVSTEGEGQVVWNDLSLKWLVRKYHIENLLITPVNMPHGEYKFMSNNPELLAKLDSIYGVLDASEQINTLRNKWFYPERSKKELPAWIWNLLAAAVLAVVAMSVFAVLYFIHSKGVARRNGRMTKRISQIMAMGHVRIWTYHVAEQVFTWRGDNGLVAYTYTEEEFAHRYSPEDFKRMMDALHELIDKPLNKKMKKGENEEEICLRVKGRDDESDDTQERDFVIALSVLHRDKEGRPTVLFGIKQDVTEQSRRGSIADEGIQRYRALFNLPTVGVLRFDTTGTLVDLNQEVCRMFACTREEVLAERVSFSEFFDIQDVDICDADGYTTIQTYDFDALAEGAWKVRSCHPTGKLVCELVCMNYADDNGDLLGVLVTCRDLTLRVEKRAERDELVQSVQVASRELALYEKGINTLLEEGNIHMATYSPQSHTMCIYRNTKEAPRVLTQMRCMTLVDEASQKRAMYIFSDMDRLTTKTLRFDIRTNLSLRGDYPIHLQFSFIPIYGEDKKVVEYFGLCQNITRQKAIECQLEQEEQKVKEVEDTKTNFINNMVEEIRTPMSVIVKSSKELVPEQDAESNNELCQEVLDNSNNLLRFIDNVLYLSRLEAHMIDMEKQPYDFVDTFATYCVSGKLNTDEVRFVTESPYEQLVINIDAPKVGNVIERVVENAIQHTYQGFIRARYDYIGGRLLITVEDTGEGIPQNVLTQLNEQKTGNVHTSKGLGIMICKELLMQMGGEFEISSEEGLGTTVWITIPCQAEAVKRKRFM